MTPRHSITFRPSGAATTGDGSRTLLDLARAAGVSLEASCGGHGLCRACVVRVDGAVRPPAGEGDGVLSTAEIAEGWRRACRTYPDGDCTVDVPPRGGAAMLATKIASDRAVPVERPVLEPVGDGYWRRGDIRVGPIDGTALGLAVDLGTTNIAASLVELATGRVVAGGARLNPQTAFGGDVIARLAHALSGEAGWRELQAAAVSAIAGLAAELTDEAPQGIAEIAVVGNTVMQHLFLGLPVESLARAPYAPAVLAPVERAAAALGLPAAPGARVYVAPSVAGFVGGDHVAALLDVLADPPDGTWALVDIGTNTEIALIRGTRIVSASCASGPAFEGAGISRGMRAAPGAIDRVAIEGGLRLHTIGEAPPVGLCGSGVLSLAAAMKRAGLVNARGRLAADAPGVVERDGTRLLELDATASPPLAFTQHDVRAVQLAKGAIRTGLDLLLADAGIVAADLDHLLIAGAFGSRIDPGDAVAIGMLPDLPADRLRQIGNVAGTGASRLVVSLDARERAERLAGSIRYLELASVPGFDMTFAGNCLFRDA